MSIRSHVPSVFFAFLCSLLVLAAAPPRAQQGPTGGRRPAGPSPRLEGAGALPRPAIDGAMQAGDRDRALEAWLAKLSAEDQFSGVVLIARNETPVFQRAFGYADRANRRRNTLETRFNLGSLNKSFTRLAIDQLVAQGRLTYTDTLGGILPDYPETVSKTATIQQLLDMTAGLTDLSGPEYMESSKGGFRSNADYYRFVLTLPPLFPPGSEMRHCNGCYIVLGEMVERLSDMPYEQYAAEHIYTPAGMKRTGFPHADAIEPNVAIGYTRRRDGDGLQSNVFLHGAAGSAAGGGFSTAEDLLAYVSACRNGRLPCPANMRVMGGHAGVSTAIQADGPWAVIVLTNMDPPVAPNLAAAILEALTS